MSEESEFIKDFNRKVEKYGLGSYEVIKDFDGTAESSEYYAWWYFPELIDFHRESRKQNSLFHIMNISILINSAIVIEGFLCELIKHHIGEYTETKNLKTRLHKELNDKLDKSSWNDLKYFYLLSIGKDLHLSTTNENWKSINILFMFRNMLTHSKPVKFKGEVIDNELKVTHFGSYENIYKFLLEKKLTNKIDIVKSMNTELINSQIADYFWNETHFFLNNVINSDEQFKKV